MKILVVDDSEQNRKLLKVLLEAQRFEVITASNGIEALKVMDRSMVNAIISDVLMPRMDGYRLCHEVRTSAKFKAVPFIVYTATYTSPSDEKVALDFGADKFLKKPASPEEIIGALHEVMNQAVGQPGKDLQGPQELLAMREYSEALVRKLEESNLQYAETNRILKERTALANFNAEIANALTQKVVLLETLQLCTEAMVRHLNAAFARIWTYNQKDHVLELQASAGMYTHLNGGHARVPVGQFKIGLIASERKPHLTNCVIGDARVNDQEWAKREGMAAFAGYPLVVDERLVGVMALFAKKPLSQNTLDAMASVANGIAAGIERKITENELRQSEERFRELAENVNEVFFSINADGSALHYVSPAYEHVFGRNKETLYQNPHDWLNAVHPGDRPRVEQAHQSPPGAFNDEYRIVRPDGQLRWIYARTFPVKNSAGQLVRSVGLAEDITERKRAEEKVQQNLERIRALHDIDTAISSTLDLRTVLNVLLEKIEIFLPIAAATTVRLLNGETGELESLACRGLDEEEWKRQQQPTPGGRAKRIVETRAPVAVHNIVDDRDTFNSDIFRKHGLVSYLGVPLIAKEKILGVLGLYVNHEHEFSKEESEFFITLAGQAAIAIHNAQLYEQTKNQQLELIEQERIQRIVKELSQDITTMDVDALLQKLTATVKEVFKVEFCDVRIFAGDKPSIGTGSSSQPSDPSLEAGGFGPGTTSAVLENRPLLARRDYAEREEFTPGKPPRKSARGFLSAALTSRSGEVLGAMRAISKEPREFTRQEIDLFEQLAHGAAVAVENSRLYTDLEKSNNVKSEFLSVMSHELRTPLNIILGYAELIKDEMVGDADQGHRSALAKIETQANGLLTMVSSIVQATEIDSGANTVHKHEVDVCQLMQELRALYDAPLDKNLVLVWKYPQSLPRLVTDDVLLTHILRKLIDNAIKFTKRGTVTVSARVNENFEFEVSDTGTGIPEGSLPVIFDMFKQADSSSTREFGGAGLGLYIVKKYTEMLGGSVTVESVVDKGSTFTVSLPSSRH
jgi:PAS domain S-box-containing protein